MPVALQGGETVNLSHRDARLALGVDRDGRLLLALTRLDLDLPAADRIPFGVTVPEELGGCAVHGLPGVGELLDGVVVSMRGGRAALAMSSMKSSSLTGMPP